ncbi:MAG: EVE domain-containing protein [Desulfitobacteriaceae bacterium]|nr:EVE domain-containing protein [Desulfitobacteriaceae bacterium]
MPIPGYLPGDKSKHSHGSKGAWTRKNWLLSIDHVNWEILKARNVWATRHRTVMERIREGDILIFYVKGSQPPSFMGVYEVVSRWRQATDMIWEDERKAQRIIYPWQISLKPLQLGTASVRDLAPRLAFIERKDFWFLYLRGTLANMRRPISEEDYQLILNELKRSQVPVPPKPERLPPPPVIPAEAPGPPEKVAVPAEISAPSHEDVVDMLLQIGETLGFVAKTEEYTPDRAYRCDVTWRDYEEHAPLKVFEVEVSGKVDHALSSLAHAHDVWRPEQLYLIVSDEKSSDRAERLVEPRLRGAFSRLRGKLKVLTWPSIKNLYDNLTPHRELVRDLSKR